jgi:hypothetical protein
VDDGGRFFILDSWSDRRRDTSIGSRSVRAAKRIMTKWIARECVSYELIAVRPDIEP